MHHTKTHSPSYKRNFKSEKPRKPRKDKGVLRRDFARLLSNYYSDEESTEMIDLENSQDNTQVESQCHDTLDGIFIHFMSGGRSSGGDYANSDTRDVDRASRNSRTICN
nr:uncharacterized protein LOC128692458 [Cherax quadricarinatus]